MKYEVPSMQIVVFETEDVIRTSLVVEGDGNGTDLGGDGNQPWN